MLLKILFLKLFESSHFYDFIGDLIIPVLFQGIIVFFHSSGYNTPWLLDMN